MDKSLKIFIIIVILLAIFATILLPVLLNKPKTFATFRKDNSIQNWNNNFYPSREANNFISCADQKHNLKQCYNICITNIRAPIKPERSGFLSNEDFYNALNEWEQLLMSGYKIAKNRCVVKCNEGPDRECKKKWCEDSKMCNSMNEEQDKMNCKKSCEDIAVKQCSM